MRLVYKFLRALGIIKVMSRGAGPTVRFFARGWILGQFAKNLRKVLKP